MATILVVDDQPTNRELLQTLLGYQGHRVLEAGDGAEALALARAERPALVISDILMPTMDGYELVRSLRDDPVLAAIPVIFYSAHYRELEARALARRLGVQHVLAKPAEPELIVRTVAAALDQPAPITGSLPTDAVDREHVRLLTDQLAAQTEALQQTNRRLSVLVELGQALAHERDPQKLTAQYCRAMREIVGARYSLVYLLADDGRTVQHGWVSGLGPDQVVAVQPGTVIDTLFGRPLRERRVLRLSGDASVSWPASLEAMRGTIDSCIAVPLVTPGGVYGWLGLVNKVGTDEFSDGDEQVLAAFGAQLGIAYENARREEQLQVRAAELEREITERKRAEAALQEKHNELAAMTQQLWHAGRLTTMGELAASIAHELNNPLATVMLRVESLLEQTPADDPGRRALGIVEQEATRMATLVSGLLQLGRGERQISTLDPCEEAERAIELMHYHLRNRRVAVQRELAAAPPLVQADRQQLRQVLLNLFTNAVDAMPEGGTLTVRVGPDGTERVVIEVADTGQGIPPDVLPRVTEPFFTTKPEGKGTGLGLALTRRIVEEHQGTLEIASTVGVGTTVRITLPAATADSIVYESWPSR